MSSTVHPVYSARHYPGTWYSTPNLYGLEKIYPFLDIEKSLIHLVTPTDKEEKQKFICKDLCKSKEELVLKIYALHSFSKKNCQLNTRQFTPEHSKMEQKIHLFYYQVNGKLLNTSLGGNQLVFIKYHKLLCPVEFSVENKKSIPTA